MDIATLERRRGLTREEFFRDYFAANRPVILEGLLDNWPAMKLWTPDYFKQKFGHEEVEIMADRDADAHFEINCEQHRRKVRFGDYVDEVINNKGNNSYLVANNGFLESAAGCAILQDVAFFPEYLSLSDTNGRVFFWFGPAGTITPLHYDQTNIFLAQVIGFKRIRFISPDQNALMYNRVGVFSDVDYDRPNLSLFPLFRFVNSVEFILSPGEVLFIPVNWWHHVRSLTPSISVSFTNFLQPPRLCVREHQDLWGAQLIR